VLCRVVLQRLAIQWTSTITPIAARWRVLRESLLQAMSWVVSSWALPLRKNRFFCYYTFCFYTESFVKVCLTRLLEKTTFV
jgi:hypothetical protein